MDSLLQKLGSNVKGVIEGFDRIVFKGMLKPLLYPGGFASFLNSREVLNKDYKAFVTSASGTIEADASRLAADSGTGPITYLPSLHTRKEEAAHNRQLELGIDEGLIGIWSCVEGCKTFRSVFDKDLGYPQLKTYSSRCKHLYFYLDHTDYGFPGRFGKVNGRATTSSAISRHWIRSCRCICALSGSARISCAASRPSPWT